MQEGKRFALKRKTVILRGAMLIVPLICTLLLLSQTVFAQNTYVITDGSRVLVHTTYATDPMTVLGEAGLELDEDDTYTTQQNQGVSEISVQRGARTAAVGGTMEVSETYTDTISHAVTYCEDASIPAGARKVLTAGQDGQLRCTASVVYRDGKEVSRTVTSRTVVQQPVAELIAVGTGAAEEASDMPVIDDKTITLPSGEVLTYTDTVHVLGTAYACEGYTGITATGTVARVGEVAVDPEVIPLGTRLFVASDDGEYIYGVATAEDTGGLIIGARVDLYFDTEAECIQFGARDCTVYILG